MHKQAVNQAFENKGMEVTREALAKSIARWTAEGDPAKASTRAASIGQYAPRRSQVTGHAVPP
jgi:hypothetical protein